MALKPAIKGTVVGLVAVPIDPMFFRGGRPFGAASRGESGLPMPQTAYGMIKTHLMRHLNIDPKEVHGLRGRDDHPNAWFARVAVRGPWLAAIKEDVAGGAGLADVFVPMPAHVVKLGEKRGDDPLEILRPLREDVAALGWATPPPPGAGAPLRPLWRASNEGKHSPATGWLGKAGLQKVLDGTAPSREDVFKDGDLFLDEDRVGIAVGANGTADDGMIYSVRLKRFTGAVPNSPGHEPRIGRDAVVGFYIEVGTEDGTHLQELKAALSGCPVLPFGGEGRRVRVHVLGAPWGWPQAGPNGAGGQGAECFATILTTPAVWGDGALCQEDPEPVRGRFTPCEQAGTLVSLAMHKPQPVSGWDIAGRTSDNERHEGVGSPSQSPKPVRYAIPAGTVVFWQAGRTGGNGEQAHAWQLAQTPADAAAGWGCALKARWNWCG